MLIMGAFNANICSTYVSNFGNMLNTVCNDGYIIITDNSFLDSEAVTFVSSAHNSCS